MTDKEAENPKLKRDRSTGYPAVALEQAVEYSAMLVQAYRNNPFSRQNAVEGIGYKKITGDSAQKIAALGHYGLLERSGNSAYRNTELAEQITFPPSDEQKQILIVTAAQTPKLFRRLIADHDGQSLPIRLSNILVNPHGINPNVSSKVAENFKKTLEYAGLLTNGVVSAPQQAGSNNDNPANSTLPLPGDTAKPQYAGTMSGPAASAVAKDMQTLVLPSGIVLMYPADLGYQFAIGKFAAQITALDTAVSSMRNNDQADDIEKTPTPSDE